MQQLAAASRVRKWQQQAGRVLNPLDFLVQLPLTVGMYLARQKHQTVTFGDVALMAQALPIVVRWAREGWGRLLAVAGAQEPGVGAPAPMAAAAAAESHDPPAPLLAVAGASVVLLLAWALLGLLARLIRWVEAASAHLGFFFWDTSPRMHACVPGARPAHPLPAAHTGVPSPAAHTGAHTHAACMHPWVHPRAHARTARTRRFYTARRGRAFVSTASTAVKELRSQQPEAYPPTPHAFSRDIQGHASPAVCAVCLAPVADHKDGQVGHLGAHGTGVGAQRVCTSTRSCPLLAATPTHPLPPLDLALLL